MILVWVLCFKFGCLDLEGTSSSGSFPRPPKCPDSGHVYPRARGGGLRDVHFGGLSTCWLFGSCFVFHLELGRLHPPAFPVYEAQRKSNAEPGEARHGVTKNTQTIRSHFIDTQSTHSFNPQTHLRFNGKAQCSVSSSRSRDHYCCTEHACRL